MKRIACALVLLAGAARADAPKLDVWNAMYGRINPLGLEDWLMVGLKQSLGPHLELAPLSILQLRFTAELGQWWGVFTTFQSFGSPLDDWSDTALYSWPTRAASIRRSRCTSASRRRCRRLWRSTKLRLYVGVRHMLVQPIYPAGAYRPGEAITNPNAHHRLRALALWTFYYRPTGRVRSLSGALIVGWYVQHRFLVGADVSPGVPFGLAGLVIATDYAR